MQKVIHSKTDPDKSKILDEDLGGSIDMDVWKEMAKRHGYKLKGLLG